MTAWVFDSPASSATSVASRGGDSFVVERNGEPVARVLPVAEGSAVSLAEALSAWRSAGEPEHEFADDLDRIGSLDRPADDPWAS